MDKQVVGAGARGVGGGGRIEVAKEGITKEGEVVVGGGLNGGR